MAQTALARGTQPKLETSACADLILLKVEHSASVMRISFNLREVYAFAVIMGLKSTKPALAFKILSKKPIDVNVQNLSN